ncbi:MAG: hypothetical protein AAB658_01725, partial [Chloroflexota bacterium]
MKRKMLTLLVEVVWVDGVKMTFIIEGEIKGTFALDDPPKGNGGFGSTSVVAPPAPGGALRLR